MHLLITFQWFNDLTNTKDNPILKFAYIECKNHQLHIMLVVKLGQDFNGCCLGINFFIQKWA